MTAVRSGILERQNKSRRDILLSYYLKRIEVIKIFKILIKYNGNRSNMWESYGNTTSSTTDSKGTFTEFETDDTVVLQTEIEKLIKQHGNENIRVIKDITVNYAATIVEDTNDGDEEVTV